jgi:hypothetical protein
MRIFDELERVVDELKQISAEDAGNDFST